MRVRRQHKAPTALTSLTENPVSGVYRLEFFPNGDRLKGQQNCQSSLFIELEKLPAATVGDAARDGPMPLLHPTHFSARAKG